MDQNREEVSVQEEQQERKKISFDPTINLGHVLTFIGFLVTGFGAYTTLDKRVVVLETTQLKQDLRDTQQDNERKEGMVQIKESLVDLKLSVEKINDKLDRQRK